MKNEQSTTMRIGPIGDRSEWIGVWAVSIGWRLQSGFGSIGVVDGLNVGEKGKEEGRKKEMKKRNVIV